MALGEARWLTDRDVLTVADTDSVPDRVRLAVDDGVFDADAVLLWDNDGEREAVKVRD